MIICSDERLAVGVPLHGELADVCGVMHQGMSFMVLRIASPREYHAYCEQEGADMTLVNLSLPYYYKVSVD